MKVATLGVNEEEATRSIIQQFCEAPNFEIKDIRLATEEELESLGIQREDIEAAKKDSVPERLN